MMPKHATNSAVAKLPPHIQPDAAEAISPQGEKGHDSPIDAKRQHAGEYLYDQVAQLLIDMIESNTLQPGERAPSLRKMSQRLNVSIATVMQAYVNLEHQGWIESRPQSGFYVRAKSARALAPPRKTSPRSQPRKVQLGDVVETIFSQANEPGVVPLGIASLSPPLMPVKGLVRATQQCLNRYAETAVKYCWMPGDYELRRQIAQRCSVLGSSVSADEIVITSGATEAISASLQAVASPGDIIAVESPTYFILLQMIERLGMLAVEIDTDPDHGMCLDALQAALQKLPIRAVLMVGNFSNPLGSKMPDECKRELVELLAERSVPLIEDDICGDLYFSGARPQICKSYDRHGLVLTCASFSKTIAPGYRVGWVLPGRFYPQIIRVKQLTSSAGNSLSQLALAEFLHTGHYERHLVRLRQKLRDQVERMRGAVAEHFPDGTRITRPQGGMVLWAQLPRGTDSLALYQAAVQENISLTPGPLFSATNKYKNFIRLSAGHPWCDEIEQALIRIGQLAREI